MFTDVGSFTFGVRVPNGAVEPGEAFIRAFFLTFIQDEKAHKEAKSLKGASGCHCCGRWPFPTGSHGLAPGWIELGCGFTAAMFGTQRGASMYCILPMLGRARSTYTTTTACGKLSIH
eukprot:9476144-Pyramimonas_sp.AAC.1